MRGLLGRIVVALASTGSIVGAATAQGEDDANLPANAEPPALLGPVLGDVRPTAARIWGRLHLENHPGAEVRWTLQRGERIVLSGDLAPRAERDGTFVVHANGLEPDTEYDVRLSLGDGTAAVAGRLRTRPETADARTARVAFGSCASHDAYERQPVWSAIARARPGTLVLLGDTPYIDDTALEHQRARYVEFWSIEELRPLAASVPVVATWDDHDFATNDQVGAQPGREDSRRAFVEYHPQGRFGDGERGVYSSFRDGPVEVFVLDTRWFGDEEPLDESLPDGPRSLLGRSQREWLVARLEASTAPVKVLACGMVWNGAVRPGKRDHWGTWAAEREAIFRAVRDSDAPGASRGIVLVGGDIHRPRVIRHEASVESLGYAPIELISSPLAAHPIAAAAAPHPGLLWDAEAASVALILEVSAPERDGGAPRVDVRFIDALGGVLEERRLDAQDLGH